MSVQFRAHELRSIAAEVERREHALERLAFCFDVYPRSHGEWRRSQRTFADGSVAMNGEKAAAQLREAIRGVLGLPPNEGAPR